MSDRLVLVGATYTTHNRRTLMQSAGLELAILEYKRLQTYAFEGRPLGSIESFNVGIYETIRNYRTWRKCISLIYLTFWRLTFCFKF